MEKSDQLISDFIGERLERRRGATIRDQQWKFHFCNGYYPDLDNMKFRTDWGWLMHVVEKINTIAIDDIGEIGVVIKPYVCYIGNLSDNNYVISVSCNGDGDKTLLDMVYKAVVNFIKFYNSTTNNPPTV